MKKRKRRRRKKLNAYQEFLLLLNRCIVVKLIDGKLHVTFLDPGLFDQKNLRRKG